MAGMAPELLHGPGCEGVSPEKSCFPVRAVSARGLACGAHTAILSLSRMTDPRIRTNGKTAQAHAGRCRRISGIVEKAHQGVSLSVAVTGLLVAALTLTLLAAVTGLV